MSLTLRQRKLLKAGLRKAKQSSPAPVVDKVAPESKLSLREILSRLRNFTRST